MASLAKRLTAEALGACILLAVVVGSGIMGVDLAQGNDAIALLGATLATGAILIVLILIFGEISGAHFNPAVTVAIWSRGDIATGHALAYIAAQIVGAVIGVILAHAMFDLALVQMGATQRQGLGQALSEAVATFGLVLTIFGCARWRRDAVAMAVGLFIMAGYWFTASTSFANPAVTLARTLTDSFAGIRAIDAPAFIIAQLVAAVLAARLSAWLFAD